MKYKFWVLGLLAGALIFTSACGMIGSLLSGQSAGTVNDLWADVPRMDGMTKADMELSLAARLALQAVMQGRMDFIAFTTDAAPQAVLDFYTLERMQADGWQAAQDGSGCFGDAETAEEGAICIFAKGAEGKTEVLGIVAGKDAETGKTAIFFARIDATEATPDASN